jgi:hypothetical protein
MTLALVLELLLAPKLLVLDLSLASKSEMALAPQSGVALAPQSAMALSPQSEMALAPALPGRM